MEFVRFFGVAVFGVLIDIAIAYILATLFGVPLWIAATAGFLFAACMNYIAHEFWTFQNGHRALSHARALKYLFTSVFTLMARISIIFIMESVLGEDYTLLVLVFAAGGSFFVNFAISKFFVFSKGGQSRAQRHDG